MSGCNNDDVFKVLSDREGSHLVSIDAGSGTSSISCNDVHKDKLTSEQKSAAKEAFLPAWLDEPCRPTEEQQREFFKDFLKLTPKPAPKRTEFFGQVKSEIASEQSTVTSVIHSEVQLKEKKENAAWKEKDEDVQLEAKSEIASEQSTVTSVIHSEVQLKAKKENAAWKVKDKDGELEAKSEITWRRRRINWEVKVQISDEWMSEEEQEVTASAGKKRKAGEQQHQEVDAIASKKRKTGEQQHRERKENARDASRRRKRVRQSNAREEDEMAEDIGDQIDSAKWERFQQRIGNKRSAPLDGEKRVQQQQQRRIEEQKAAEEEEKRRVEQRKAAKEEKQRRVQERKVAEEEEKRRMEEQKAAEEEEKRRIEKRKAAREEKQRRVQERKAAEEEEQRRIREQKAAEEEEKRRIEQRKAAKEEKQRRVQERKAAEEEEQRRMKEQKAAEEEEKRRMEKQHLEDSDSQECLIPESPADAVDVAPRNPSRHYGLFHISWVYHKLNWMVQWRSKGQQHTKTFLTAKFLQEGMTGADAIEAALRAACEYRSTWVTREALTGPKYDEGYWCDKAQKWAILCIVKGERVRKYFRADDDTAEAKHRAHRAALEAQRERERKYLSAIKKKCAKAVEIEVRKTQKRRKATGFDSGTKGIRWSRHRKFWITSITTQGQRTQDIFRPVDSTPAEIQRSLVAAKRHLEQLRTAPRRSLPKSGNAKSTKAMAAKPKLVKAMSAKTEAAKAKRAKAKPAKAKSSRS